MRGDTMTPPVAIGVRASASGTEAIPEGDQKKPRKHRLSQTAKQANLHQSKHIYALRLERSRKLRRGGVVRWWSTIRIILILLQSPFADAERGVCGSYSTIPDLTHE
jgi:hypothetical protein